MKRWSVVAALTMLLLGSAQSTFAADVLPSKGFFRLYGYSNDVVAYERVWTFTTNDGTWTTIPMPGLADSTGIVRPTDIVIDLSVNSQSWSTLGTRWTFGFHSVLPLKPGTYQIAPGESRVDLVARDGNSTRSCLAEESGSFQIRTISYECVDGEVHVTGLNATFSRMCGTESRAAGEFIFESEKVGTPCAAAPPPDGEDGSGEEGEPETPPVKVVPFQLALPFSIDDVALPIHNAESASVKLTTVIDPTFDNDIQVSVTSDAEPQDDFTVSVAPSLIPKPGNGEAEITVKTGPMTFPRLYNVTVSATSGTDVSTSSFRVDVQCDPPFILGTDQPKTITAQNGTQVQLDVTAGGTGPLFYQWFKGHPNMIFRPIAAAHESTLIFTTRGTENYWVRVSNACGSVNSLPATVNTVGSLQGVARRRSGGN